MKKVTKKVDYRKIVDLMKKERLTKKHTKKDVDLIIEASKNNDWKEVHKTKLYNDFSGHYCSLLEILSHLELIG